MLSAHGDQMVRTQARAAYLTILRGLLDEKAREKAIQLAQEILSRAIPVIHTVRLGSDLI